jgi:hypothetical protein
MEWERIGGQLASSPAVATAGPDRFDVFVRGTDYALWWIYTAGNGWQWEQVGGALTSTPVVTARLDIFVRGMDASLWWVHIRGSSWYWERISSR